jgi:hypothetical protein
MGTGHPLPVASFEPSSVLAPVPVYFSNIGWTGEPDDPNRHYRTRRNPGARLLDSDHTGCAASRRCCSSAISRWFNSDRALDDMVRMAIDGCMVRLLCGRLSDDYPDFEPVFVGTAQGWKLGATARSC